jgi:hypothetical protein
MMLGALVGINFYSVNIKDHTALPFSFTQENVQYSNDDPIKHENRARSSYPSFGLFVNRSLPYVHKNLSLQYELVYNRQSIESRYSYSHPIRKIDPAFSSEPFSETIVDNEIHLDMSYLSHYLMFKYVLNAYRFSPALYIGGFINTHINSSYQQNVKIFNISEELLVESDFSGEQLYNNKAGFIIANGLTCGIGTKVGISPRIHLLINLRYIRSFEMVGFEEAVSNNINLNLNLPILY